MSEVFISDWLRSELVKAALEAAAADKKGVDKKAFEFSTQKQAPLKNSVSSEFEKTPQFEIFNLLESAKNHYEKGDFSAALEQQINADFWLSEFESNDVFCQEAMKFSSLLGDAIKKRQKESDVFA